MKRLAVLLIACTLTLGAGERRAQNVILFIGDATGIPVLNAASIYGYDKPQQLYIQHMPHIGLSDTSSASDWVTDSAAGMTAIVTGQKTDNGVLSESPISAGKDRRPLKTILEYAEQRGLSTGVMTTSSIWDATPAACFAHVDSREKETEIFRNLLAPRFGDGVDFVASGSRNEIIATLAKQGADAVAMLRDKGYAVYERPNQVPADARRAAIFWDPESEDLTPAIDKAIDVLSKNPKGFFLMVEEEVDTDLHPGRPEAALKRALRLDRMIRHTAERMGDDTLILFAADHSFDFRLRHAKRGTPLVAAAAAGGEDGRGLAVTNSHAGEEILVAAQGPGSERVRGFFPNTELFYVMMSALGW